MFDFLQQSHNKLVDASKFDIRSFEPDQSETQEKEIQWLLVHLYFLCLKHLGNMTKNWWLDTKKRIKGPVETWTERFVSLFLDLLCLEMALLTTIRDLAFDYRRLTQRGGRVDGHTGSQRGARAFSEDFSQDCGDHREHPC